MVRIGEDRTERLDIVPAQFRVIVTVRPKYACRKCEEGVTQAPSPAWLIEGALPTEALLAHVLVSKFSDHLPLYRLSRIFARSGIDLHRSTLAEWVGKASFHLRPVVRLPEGGAEDVEHAGAGRDHGSGPRPGPGQDEDGLHVDDGARRAVVVRVRSAGRGVRVCAQPQRQAWRDAAQGFQGTVQVDGYAGHNRLARADRPGGALTLAACWIHARRGLKEIFDSNGSPIAKAGLERHRAALQDRGQDPGRAAGDAPVRAMDRGGAAGERLRGVLDEQRSRVSPRSRLGEKLTYIANQWNRMLVFLYDGRVEMDSNLRREPHRPVKLTAKNALFAGHDEGARSWGRIGSLIETCKMNGVEPWAWLKSTLEKIAAGHPLSKIHELLPWNFEPGADPT